MKPLLLSLGLALVGSAPVLAAQVPVTPVPVAKCQEIGLALDLKALTENFLAGNWSQLDTVFKAARTALGPCIADGEQWIVFVWPGKNAVDDASLFSVVFPGVAPFSPVLPGVSSKDQEEPGLYEVFISPTKGAVLRSAYLITREDNPLVAQAAAALEKNLEKLIGGAGALAGFAGGVASDAVAPRPLASVSRIGLPFERGKIIVKRRAEVPKLFDELRADADKLVVDASLREARDSQPAKDLATVFATKLRSGLTGLECAGPDATHDRCRLEIARLMGQEYQVRFGAAPAAEQPTLAAVDKRFRDHVAAIAPTKIDHDSVLINEPKTHVSIGTLVGYIIAVGRASVRVKVSSTGQLMADPLPRALTGVTINWSPRGFQASDPTTPRAKRFRLFTGVAITPNVGVLLGATAQVFNGFSVNGGVAFLAMPTGEIESKPSSSQPFRTDWGAAPFLGAGFSWK